MTVVHRRALALAAFAAALLVAGENARAQNGYFASIAYSQSTGRIGYSARQARSKQGADQYALRMCAAEDAKVFMWARDQWVAIAVVVGQRGNAGFGRGESAAEAQQKALEECVKRAHGHACRVALCVHSSGRRIPDEQLRTVAATPATSRTGFFGAIAFSQSTGRIGSTAGVAKTIEEAKELALKDCGEEDAKVFMWGDQWIAVAVAPALKGVAGFAPGPTREAAEKAALEQCAKYSKGAPCRIALVLFSTGEEEPPVVQAGAEEPAEPAEEAPAEEAPAEEAPAAETQEP
jgi:hypothetical protein